MKTQILALTALAAILGAEGALADCEFRQETNDFFSGVPTLRTAWAPVNPGDCKGDCNGWGSLSMVKEPEKQWLEFDAWFNRSYIFAPAKAVLDDLFVVPLGTNLQITLADGTVVELPISSPVKGTTRITYPYESNNDNYIVRASARMHFDLSESALATLGAQRASTVRLVGEMGRFTMPVPKKKQAVMNAAKCLQEGDSK